MLLRAIGVTAAIALVAGSAMAQDKAADKLKIGLITTLSGPPAAIGQQQRNGLMLALKELGGKLGGRDVELLVQDDELKPDVAVTKVKAFIERDKVDFVVGPVFSNILAAILKPVTESGTFMISPNAGTSSFAGKDCNPNLFVTSYQNDQNARDDGQIRAGFRPQEGVLDGPQLSGRQGRARRLQALLQGRGGGRSLRPAQPARLRRRTVEDRGGFARRHFRVPARRHGRQLRQAVPSGRFGRQGQVPLRLHRRRGNPAGAAGRRARLLWRRNWAPNIDNSAEQGVRGGLREGIRRRAGDLRVPGL